MENRYSNEELEEFKVIVQAKLDEAKASLKFYNGQLSYRDDHGTDDTAKAFKPMEQGNATLSREEMANLAARQEKFVRDLEFALIRIANKTYGICRETGNLIEKARLKAVPHATLCIAAKKARK